MIEIRNKLNQNLIIDLNSKRSIDLLGKSKAEVTEAEFDSPHLQNFISRGMIIVSRRDHKEQKPKPGKMKPVKQKSEDSEPLKPSEPVETEPRETDELTDQETLSSEESEVSEPVETVPQETDEPKPKKYGYSKPKQR